MKWNQQWIEEKNNDYWKTPDPDVKNFLNTLSNKSHCEVLDYGCGLGRHSILFAKNGFKVTSIDISENAINYLQKWATKENLNITITNSGIDNLIIENKKYDIILAYNVIYHGFRYDVKNQLSNIKKILSSNGYLYFTIPSRKDGKYGFGKQLEPHTFSCDKSVHKGDIHYFTDETDLSELLVEYNNINLKKDEYYWNYKGERLFSSYFKVICKPK